MFSVLKHIWLFLPTLPSGAPWLFHGNGLSYIITNLHQLGGRTDEMPKMRV